MKVGIDVLVADGFRVLRGKRIGLLTHPAGRNQKGESTIDILRGAPGVNLVALFAPEHGLYGQDKASATVVDTTDSRTGLPVYSLHGKNRQPTPQQLKGLDALVIDLQDIGVRSYSFSVTMRYAIEACFLNNIEVVVLDRPNPLGGLKVDGPVLDQTLMSGVGAFSIPYIHGLTIGELARFSVGEPGMLNVSDEVRLRGRLVVIPMHGWSRKMTWPATGLNYIPTSPLIQNFDQVVGNAMMGLGCEFTGFKSGLGDRYPFQTLSFKGKSVDQLQADLIALHIPGVHFHKETVRDGYAGPALFVEVDNWNVWSPTELSFNLMVLACRYRGNVFAQLSSNDARTFNIHVGSTAWWEALKKDGENVDLKKWREIWSEQAKVYEQKARKYRLYN